MSHPAWSLAKSYYCLNLDKRPEQWDKCVEEFIKVGIDYVERIITHESEENRYISFNHAHYDCIKRGYETGEPFCIFEHDIAFDENWKRLEEATAQLPADWDILFIGANIIGDWQMPHKAGNNLARVYNAWQTHAIIYSNKMAKWILDNFNPDEFPVYDEWLRVNALVPRECFVMIPMCCYQRPGWSDINQSEANYGCHKEGNEWFKNNLI